MLTALFLGRPSQTQMPLPPDLHHGIGGRFVMALSSVSRKGGREVIISFPNPAPSWAPSGHSMAMCWLWSELNHPFCRDPCTESGWASLFPLPRQPEPPEPTFQSSCSTAEGREMAAEHLAGMSVPPGSCQTKLGGGHAQAWGTPGATPCQVSLPP